VNHKAELIDWSKVGHVIAELQRQKRWRELLAISCASFTVCRPSDWCKFRWVQFMDEKGIVKDHFGLVEKKIKGIMESKGKVAKPRQIYLSEEFQEIVRECWIGHGKPDINGFMFKGSRGPSGNGISTNAANAWWKKLTLEFDLPAITNYSFRKASGIQVAQSSNSPMEGIQQAQALYGHKSMMTTIIYLQLGEKAAANAFSKLTFK